MIRCNHNYRILIQTRFFEFTKDPADLLIYKRHRCEVSCLDFLRKFCFENGWILFATNRLLRAFWKGLKVTFRGFRNFNVLRVVLSKKPLWSHEWSVRAVKPQSQEEWFPRRCELTKFSHSLRRTDPIGLLLTGPIHSKPTQGAAILSRRECVDFVLFPFIPSIGMNGLVP